jgi:hypothetical protein
LEVILMAISRARAIPFDQPGKGVTWGLELRLDEINHAGGNNLFIRFVLTMKGRECRC